MNYFAYGSNMSLARLQARVPSAHRIASAVLSAHSLRFHKSGQDGSGKCDAFHTLDDGDSVIGAVFRLDPLEKPGLDLVEGLGFGYAEKSVSVICPSGVEHRASTYYATAIDLSLKPFSWYRHHVLVGAMESALPDDYIRRIEAVDHVEDPDRARDRLERALHAAR